MVRHVPLTLTSARRILQAPRMSFRREVQGIRTSVSRTVIASLSLALVVMSSSAAAEEGVAAGFSLSVVTDRVPNARQMAETDSGLLLVGSRSAGNLYAVTLAPGREAEVMTFASGLTVPSGIALIGDDLYVGALNRVLRYRDIERTFRGRPQPEVVTDTLPQEHHGWKYLSLGPDGYLYVPVGAPCNICQREEEVFATILRMHPDTGERSIYAHGVRNSVGMDWHPETGRLWFTDNGRDWMGDDLPPEEVNVVEEAGAHYGFPHIHGTDIRDPQFGANHDPADYVAPVYEIQAHSAALGMAFYDGNRFPAAYAGALFIAEHGSWNRSSKVGYRVSVVRAGETAAEPFVDVWLDGQVRTGRPADVLVARDGTLLISDDYGGRIYRVTALAVEVLPTALTLEPGASATYAVALSTRPEAEVTVTVDGASADVRVSGSPLTFTPTNWDAAQTVTVSATAQAAAGAMVTLTHFASGGDYAGLAAPEVTVTVSGMTESGVLLSASTLVVEEGGSATYTVRLATRPSGDVTVTVDGATGEMTVGGPPLVFTPSNWMDAQTVTVTALEDSDALADAPVILSHSASGADYDDLAANSVTVTVREDDLPRPRLEAGGDAAIIDLSVLFGAMGDDGLTYSGRSSAPSLAMVTVEGDELTITPNEDGDEGLVAVTATATGSDGGSMTLTFEVIVDAVVRGRLSSWRWALPNAAADAEQPAGP